jgi:hypothetical protein
MTAIQTVITINHLKMRWLIKRILAWIWPELRSELGVIKLLKPIQIDKWREYAENLAIEVGLDPENILVHNYGRIGACGKKIYTTHSILFPKYWGSEVKIPIPILGKPYIIVPEIIDWWTFMVWIHEIGHFVNGHYDDRIKPLFIQEFEAEKYCYDKCKESGLLNDTQMIDVKFSCVSYLSSHVLRAIEFGEIKYKEDIPQEVYDFLFMCNYMREEISNKNLPSKLITMQVNTPVDAVNVELTVDTINI